MFKNYLWISHSAISAYDRCPQSYYYQYQYKNPATGNRIQTVNSYFSLGLAVHETIEKLGNVSIEERLKISLKKRYNDIWKNYTGRKGGFISEKIESDFKKRGERMIERVINSNFLEKKSTTIPETVPNIDLIPEKDIKLVGLIDWIEVLPNGDLHIIDFKTGKNKEKNDSLQLLIYKILVKEKLKVDVKKISYWYLETDDKPTSKRISLDIDTALLKIKEKALEIKRSVDSNIYPCNYNGKCFACSDYKEIFAGNAEYVGEENGKDLYFILKESDIVQKIIDEKIFDLKTEKVFSLRMEGKNIEEIEKELKIKGPEMEKIIKYIKQELIKNLSKKELRLLIDTKLSG